MYFEDRHLDAVDYIRDAFRRDLSLAGGLMVRDCAALYVGPDVSVPKEEQVNR
jgi:tRNA(adenine34) deaminase